MDRLDEWKVFLAVAGSSSFVRAARSLGRSPQAITRAVAALEDRLGTRLLNRTTQSVSLTHDGERFLEQKATNWNFAAESGILGLSRRALPWCSHECVLALNFP